MRYLLGVGLLGLASVATGAPGDRFGGDELACVPLDGAVKKCEQAVARALAKAAACLVECQAKRASEKLLDAAAIEACKAKCASKYEGKTGAASSIVTSCPAWFDAGSRGFLYEQLETTLARHSPFPCSTTCAAYAAPCSCGASGFCLPETGGDLVCTDPQRASGTPCDSSSQCTGGQRCIDSVGARYCTFVCP